MFPRPTRIGCKTCALTILLVGGIFASSRGMPWHVWSLFHVCLDSCKASRTWNQQSTYHSYSESFWCCTAAISHKTRLHCITILPNLTELWVRISIWTSYRPYLTFRSVLTGQFSCHGSTIWIPSDLEILLQAELELRQEGFWHKCRLFQCDFQLPADTPDTSTQKKGKTKWSINRVFSILLEMDQIICLLKLGPHLPSSTSINFMRVGMLGASAPCFDPSSSVTCPEISDVPVVSMHEI